MHKGSDLLLALSTHYGGDWDKEMGAVRRRDYLSKEVIEESLAKVGSMGVVTMLDDSFPPQLRPVWKPPLVLYYEGDFSLVQKEEKCVTYVGSRDCSAYGAKMAREIGAGLAKHGYVLVSGLARGIDAAAMEGALEAGGRVVAVLGTGVDVCYPLGNKPLYERIRRSGLLLSEYPPGTKAKPEHFPMRNRILAFLSKVVVIGEAGPRSGTAVTANYAIGSSKDVGCIPFRAGEGSLCNRLINQGAYLIDGLDDLLFLLEGLPKKENSEEDK